VAEQPTAASSSAAPTWARDALGLAKSPRTQRVARAVTLSVAGWEVGRKVYQQARQRLTYQVSVPATDDLYGVVVAWLSAQVPEQSRRSVTVTTGRQSSGDDDQPVSPDGPGWRPPERRTVETYDGRDAQTVRIAGHRVRVELRRDSLSDLGLTVQVSGGTGSWRQSLERVLFIAYGPQARAAVLQFLDDLRARHLTGEQARPRMWIATRWGDWRRVRETPPRKLETVILPAEQRERIVADLARFLELEDRYAAVGVPWHHGLLFHGPPGTGKTSLATALADHFHLDVHLLPLADLEDDTQMVTLLANVDVRSVLVLEDVDVVHQSTHDRGEPGQDGRKGITLSGLLNALDGMATPHGLVTIMTTNRLDILDDALVRPGRADQVEEFGYLDVDQAARMVHLATGSLPLFLHGVPEALTHAELLGAAKPHLADPDAAYAAMMDMLSAIAKYPRGYRAPIEHFDRVEMAAAFEAMGEEPEGG
jgi:hypothetical protein